MDVNEHTVRVITADPGDGSGKSSVLVEFSDDKEALPIGHIEAIRYHGSEEIVGYVAKWDGPWTVYATIDEAADSVIPYILRLIEERLYG